MSSQNDHIVPATRWQALIGTLPFLCFGFISMIGKIDQFNNTSVLFIYLAFYLLVLSGLLIGWTREFPLWSYGYLGWSLLFALWWLSMRINGIFLGPYTWLIFWVVVLIAIIWTRSFSPIKRFFFDIWHDWTRLTLAMYTFIAFVFLIYDENHHPYLFIFMSASALVISAGAWFFLRSPRLLGRVASILGGLFTGYVLSTICDRTWDAASYYNIPEGPAAPWFMTAFRTIMMLSFFIAVLLWPVIISLYQRMISRPAENL
jgi:hypothetical protein